MKDSDGKYSMGNTQNTRRGIRLLSITAEIYPVRRAKNFKKKTQRKRFHEM